MFFWVFYANYCPFYANLSHFFAIIRCFALILGVFIHFFAGNFPADKNCIGANMYTFCMSGAGLGVDRNGAGLGGARPENRQASLGQSSLLAGCWLIHITRCCLAWSPYKMLKNWMAVANRPPAQHSGSLSTMRLAIYLYLLVVALTNTKNQSFCVLEIGTLIHTLQYGIH